MKSLLLQSALLPGALLCAASEESKQNQKQNHKISHPNKSDIERANQKLHDWGLAKLDPEFLRAKLQEVRKLSGAKLQKQDKTRESKRGLEETSEATSGATSGAGDAAATSGSSSGGGGMSEGTGPIDPGFMVCADGLFNFKMALQMRTKNI